ncbi:hypothetical protein TNIN_342211, partial [Trichonephila inaurata madagascariensis]
TMNRLFACVALFRPGCVQVSGTRILRCGSSSGPSDRRGSDELPRQRRPLHSGARFLKRHHHHQIRFQDRF